MEIISAADTDELRRLMSGQHDALYDEANALLQSSKMYPYMNTLGKYPTASHVEAKYAAWMKREEVSHAKVIINNNEGACGYAMNCENAVAAILPAGHTLEVYYPGAGSPKLLRGARVAP
ncbi:DddA-like double-stranded DNA deaminase toxin [Streptomyces sp. NPDC058391]|uniref:DddA-like double-stranded DNA deaminase toxin n=1 Tax=Streptomyces sp. NPDC058391 TaxID=3346476 RepID=UPI003661E0EE